MGSIKHCTTKKDVSNFTKDEIINLALNYYKSNGKIILRDFKNKNGLPSSATVTKLFGSFENLLKEANIPIRKDKLHNFGRKYLTDAEMLNLLKGFTEEYLLTHLYLPINDEIDKDKSIPSCSAYVSRFGSFDNAYKLIGYDVKTFNNSALEKDMINKYKNMCYKVGHTLNSREITKLSRENKDCIYSTEAYTNHFGSIHNLQDQCGFIKTVVGKGMTREESIQILKDIKNIIGEVPTQKDLSLFKFAPSANFYIKYFGSYSQALKEAGFKNTSKIRVTKSGIKCLSSYEYKMVLVFEFYNYMFSKEIYYKDIIPDFNRNYRFDFMINQNNRKYYLEVFGIDKNTFYENRKTDKINICKLNNVPLIEVYPDDIFGKTHEEVHCFIQSKIKELEGEECNGKEDTAK